MPTPLHVVHLSTGVDSKEREPRQLLEDWFTLCDVAEAVAGQGVEVTVVQAAVRDAALERGGVSYRFLRTPTPGRLRRRAGLWATPIPSGMSAVLQSLRPAVVHFHGFAFPRHVREVSRAVPGVPILVQDHADSPAPWWLRWLARRGFESVSGIAFTAPEQGHRFIRSGVLQRDVPLFLIPETSSHFTPGSQREAQEGTGLFGDPCLLWIGHLNCNKDPLTVLEAAARAFPNLPDPHLWFAFRRSALLPEVEARMREDPSLAGRIHLLGPQRHEKVEDLLRASDFFVLGSHEEGSGVALIEALACGTIPIVTDIPSFRELTGRGAVGALSPPGDADSMSRNLLEWYRKDRGSLGASARSHFEEHLSFSVVGRKLAEAYRCLSREGGSSETSVVARGRRSEARAAPSDVAFRSHRPGDEESLTDLFRTCFDRPANPGWWRWKLLGRRSEADPVIVGEDGEGRPVFQMGGIPRAGNVAGRTVRVMVAVDAMTRPDRREEGILTAGCTHLFDRWRNQGVDLVLGLPNEAWGSRLSALGWRPLFPLRWRVRVLRPERILGRRSRLSWLGGIRGPGRLWNRWWDRPRGQETCVDLEDGVPDDGDLDAADARFRYGTPYTLHRDSAWLRWRYLDAPDGSYRILSARREGRLVGWAAYRLREKEGRTTGFLAEICAAQHDVAAEAALLHGAVRRLRSAGAELVAALETPGTGRDRRLGKVGFFPAWGAFEVHCVPLDSGLPVEAMTAPRSWCLEGGDFDVL